MLYMQLQPIKTKFPNKNTGNVKIWSSLPPISHQQSVANFSKRNTKGWRKERSKVTPPVGPLRLKIPCQSLHCGWPRPITFYCCGSQINNILENIHPVKFKSQPWFQHNCKKLSICLKCQRWVIIQQVQARIWDKVYPHQSWQRQAYSTP